MAAYSFVQPRIDAATPAEKQIKSYLMQLDEYLRHSLDSGSVGGGNSLAAGKGTGSGARPVEMSEEVVAEFNKIRDRLLKLATQFATASGTIQEINDNYMSWTAWQDYWARTEGYGDVFETMQSNITQDARDIKLNFDKITELQGITEGTNQSLEALQTAVNDEHTYTLLQQTCFDFSADGLKISTNDSDFSIKITNDRLSFMYTDKEVAYMSNNKLFINQGDFADRFGVGGDAMGGFYDFVTTPSGMGIKWRGI